MNINGYKIATYEQWIIRQVVLGLPDSVAEYESESAMFAEIYGG